MRDDGGYGNRGADQKMGRGMSDRKVKQPSYEICVVGHLDNLWGEWFDSLP